MYDEGEGVVQDKKMAVDWYTKSAKQGEASAQFNLAVMYAEGEGVPQNDKTAVHWYLKAAEQGDADAQYNLALMYKEGLGVPKDHQQAYAWLSLAATHGDADAITARNRVRSGLSDKESEAAQALAVKYFKKYNQ